MKTRLSDFGSRSPAEDNLLDAVQRGVWARVSDSVPDEPTPEVTIRASFIRYLALGGCDACRPAASGVRVWGAWIAGDGDPAWPTQGLYLDGADLCADLYLVACHIPDTVYAYGARAKTLGFDRSRLTAGLRADRLHTTGGVFLRQTEITGTVRLGGARIGGTFECDGARLRVEEGATALFADGFQTTGDVFLPQTEITGAVRLPGASIGGHLDCDGAKLRVEKSGTALFADGLQTTGGVVQRKAEITGAVRVVGARIGGNLECDGARVLVGEGATALFADRLQTTGNVFLQKVEITGEVRLLGARIGRNLICDGANLRTGESGTALCADSLRAEGGFFLRDGAIIDGALDLTQARVAAIADHADCWPVSGNLLLDRFRYDAILDGPVDADSRLKWLALQDPSRFGKDFWPQPYEQLAKVLREMGHIDDARRVLVEKERLLRADRRKRVRRDAPYAKLRFDRVWDAVLSVTAGYGHRPMRAVLWLFGFWLLGAMVFASAADREALKPNNAFVLRAPEWAACDPDYVRQTGGPPVRWSAAYTSQLACFLDQPEAVGYPIFNPFFYSADTLLPIVDLEMQTYWIPDERHARWTRYFLWLQIGMGWALSLLAVAGFSGLVKSD